MCSLTFRSSIFSLWKWQNYFWEAQPTSEDLPEKTREQTAEVVNIGLELVIVTTAH